MFSLYLIGWCDDFGLILRHPVEMCSILQNVPITVFSMSQTGHKRFTEEKDPCVTELYPLAGTDLEDRLDNKCQSLVWT